MPLSLNTNISAVTARRNLLKINDNLKTSMERLSSGLRINRSADDAAGLTIAENLKSQIIGLNRAVSNAIDGISLIQTGEGAMKEGNAILQRIRQLSVQAANGTLTSKDRLAIQNEVVLLIDEINRIASTTTFNNINLLNGNSSALVSTNNPADINGIVVGDVGDGGIFSITVHVSESSNGERLFGKNQVVSTEILTTMDARGNYYDANSQTTLQSISLFREFKVFDGGVRSVVLTLSSDGDNKIAYIELFATDTLEITRSRFSLAINNPNQTTDLDLGGGISYGANLVSISSVGISQAGGSDGSTILVVTNPEPGRKLVWGGDDKTLSALGFMQIQEPQPPIFSVTVNHISSPFQQLVPRHQKVFGERVSGLIKGVDIDFRPTLNISLSGFESTRIGAFNIPKLVVSRDMVNTSFLLEVTPRPLIFQIGSGPGDVLQTRISDISAPSLGIQGINIIDQALAGDSIRMIDSAIKRLNAERATIGAVQNRLESTISSLRVASENLTGSESQIRDLDFSDEIVNFTALQVLNQSASFFLSQANAMSSVVLSLIGGGG